MHFIVNTLIAALLISVVTSISITKPKLAGYIIALPLASIIAVLLAYLQHKDSTNTIQFARSIFFAVPVTILFFVPFLFAAKFQLSFWSSYTIGIALLVVGYFIHRLLPI